MTYAALLRRRRRRPAWALPAGGPAGADAEEAMAWLHLVRRRALLFQASPCRPRPL